MSQDTENNSDSPEIPASARKEARSLLARPRTETILHGPIAGTLWRLSIPTWAAFVCMNMMGVVDMFFVGRLGPVPVAAVGMGSIMIGIIIMFALGVSMGTTALVANATGRRDRARADLVTSQAVTIAIGLGIVITLTTIPLAPFIIRAMGAEPDVVAEGADYLQIVAGGSIFLLIHIALVYALRGAGDAVTPMKALMLSILVNVVLDPIMIFGMFGFPALGVAGSALATVLSRLFGMFLVLYVLLGDHDSAVSLHISQMWPRWEIIRNIFRIGVFASGRALLHDISRLAFMRLAAMFGTPAVAAFSICFRLIMFILGPGKGFGTAAAAMVGQNLGAEQPARAEKAGWMAGAFALGVGLLFTAAFWAAPATLIRFFNSDPDVVETGVSLLRWFASSFPILLMGFVLGEAMMGAGDSLRPMLITGISEVLLAVPMAVFLAFYFDTASGVWAAFFAANLLTGLLFAGAFKIGWWKHIDVNR
ncbi:MAG: MATE family efflux transporter [Planctomycetota bacterium]